VSKAPTHWWQSSRGSKGVTQPEEKRYLDEAKAKTATATDATPTPAPFEEPTQPTKTRYPTFVPDDKTRYPTVAPTEEATASQQPTHWWARSGKTSSEASSEEAKRHLDDAKARTATATDATPTPAPFEEPTQPTKTRYPTFVPDDKTRYPTVAPTEEATASQQPTHWWARSGKASSEKA
jgi:hypothetical protein